MATPATPLHQIKRKIANIYHLCTTLLEEIKGSKESEGALLAKQLANYALCFTSGSSTIRTLINTIKELNTMQNLLGKHPADVRFRFAGSRAKVAY
jgi:hypothetical protein